MTYFSEAQLPRSMIRHRSLQNGKAAVPAATSFLQMGQRIMPVAERC